MQAIRTAYGVFGISFDLAKDKLHLAIRGRQVCANGGDASGGGAPKKPKVFSA